MAMDYGIIVPHGWRMDLVGIADPIEAYEAMTRVAQEAEALGFHSIWLYDHFHTVPLPSQEVTFECWTSTAALARDTHRTHIGQMVTCNSYRNPALLAKMASTVDAISHGRLVLGIGAGWYEHEYRAYGYPYLQTAERLQRLHEAIQIILAMWTQDEATFEGTYYHVRGTINQPRGVQPNQQRPKNSARLNSSVPGCCTSRSCNAPSVVISASMHTPAGRSIHVHHRRVVAGEFRPGPVYLSGGSG